MCVYPLTLNILHIHIGYWHYRRYISFCQLFFWWRWCTCRVYKGCARKIKEENWRRLKASPSATDLKDIRLKYGASSKEYRDAASGLGNSKSKRAPQKSKASTKTNARSGSKPLSKSRRGTTSRRWFSFHVILVVEDGEGQGRGGQGKV